MSAIEFALHWRWLLVLALVTALLAEHVFPSRAPDWDVATLWLTSAAAVIAGEVALLLHELSHALVARGRGQAVQRIVFHGFVAETVLGEGGSPSHEIMIALVGPATNLMLASIAQSLRLAFLTSGPVDTVLTLAVLGNFAAAIMSLVPFGASDGARVMRVLRSAGSEGQVAGQRHDQNDQDQ